MNYMAFLGSGRLAAAMVCRSTPLLPDRAMRDVPAPGSGKADMVRARAPAHGEAGDVVAVRGEGAMVCTQGVAGTNGALGTDPS